VWGFIRKKRRKIKRREKRLKKRKGGGGRDLRNLCTAMECFPMGWKEEKKTEKKQGPRKRAANLY